MTQDHEDVAPTAMDSTWRRTSPVAVLFFLGRAFRKLLSSFANMAASVAGILVLVKQHPLLAVAAVVVVVLGFVAVAILRYWHFQFMIDDDRILVRQGVLKKTQLDLRFERIQGINTEQSFLYRLLGLVTVRFDTAGSGGHEGVLPAVPPGFVATLRERIDRERHTGDAPRSTAPADLSEIVVRLGSAEVAYIGLTDPQALRFALLGAAFASAFGQAFEEALPVVQSAAAQLAGFGLFGAATTVLGGLVVLVGLFLAGSVVVALLRFHDFQLRREGTAFRSGSGLITRKEVVVESPKIQQLQVVQGLRMRWIERFRLQALSAGNISGDTSAGAADRLVVPLLDGSGVEEIRRRVMASEGKGLRLLPESRAFAAVSAYSIWPPVLWCGLLPAVAGTVVLGLAFGTWGIGCLAWLLPVALVSWQRWRRRGYLHDDDGMVVRSGFLGYRLDAFLFRKAQNVSITQSPLQRRKGLARLRVHLACGSVSIPYIDHATARRLRDYILFEVESSRLPWY